MLKDPYAIDMMSGTSMAIHIFWLHASIVAHMLHPVHVGWYGPYPQFPLRSSLGLGYHDYMMTRAQEWYGPKFQLQGAWVYYHHYALMWRGV